MKQVVPLSNRNKFLEGMGWAGGILLAFCGLPEAIATIVRGSCALSWGLLLMWLFGEIFVLIPVWLRVKKNWLLVNYIANIIFVLIMVYYKALGG